MKWLLLLCTACSTMYDPCFAPPSTVSSLRVLAVRADPPEIVYDPAIDGTLPVGISVLAAAPGQTNDRVSLRVRLCSRPDVTGRCTGTPWLASASGDFDHLPEFTVAVPFAMARDAATVDPLAGYGGARITVDVEATSLGVTAAATKLLVASPARAGYVPNHGLRVTDVRVTHKNGESGIADEATLLQLSVGESVAFSPDLAPDDGATDAAEEYTVTDLAGRTQTLRERISYSFYVTPHAQYGAIGRPEAGADVADEPLPGEPRPVPGLVLLSPLAESPARAYVVARDGRGGEAWLRLDLNITDHRQCSFDVGNGTTVVNQCASLDVGCL